MNQATFNKKIASVFILFLFLATPLTAFAQGCSGGSCGGSGFNGGGCSGGGCGGQSNGGAFGGAFDQNTLMMMMLLGGGRGGLGALGGGLGGGGGGPAGTVGQALTMAGLLSGNMGLAFAGMLTSMIGGLAGGAGGQGATPQQGRVDEQYVGQGYGYPQYAGSNNPYYGTPAPLPTPTPTPVAAACSQSLFVVRDTTVTPATVKPYPATASIATNSCILAVNTDSAAHTVQAKRQGESAVIVAQQVAANQSQVFRFATPNTYTLCLDATTACATVTVQ